MEVYRCCFTGHRIIPLKDREPLDHALRETIRVFAKNGMEEFICGGALGFDTMAALEVLRQKKDFPHIRLTLVIPCKDQAARWTGPQKKIYQDILEKADSVICLFDHYVNGCMQMRNRYMVDHAHVCVAYYNGGAGGTAYTLRYAKEKNVLVQRIPVKEVL